MNAYDNKAKAAGIFASRTELTTAQKNAITLYTSPDAYEVTSGNFIDELPYELINDHLRDRRTSGDKRIVGAITELTDAMRTVARDVTVYRGGWYPSHQIGTEWDNPSFTSTSLDVDQARSFRAVGKRIMRIKIPAGLKALYLDNLSQMGEEREVLLPPGARFRVVGNDDVYLDVEVLT